MWSGLLDSQTISRCFLSWLESLWIDDIWFGGAKKKRKEKKKKRETDLSHDIYLFGVHQLQQRGGCIGVAAGEGESKEHNAQKEDLHVFSFFFLSFRLFLCL